MANIGDLVVTLDANTQGLERGLDRATAATGRYRDAQGRLRETNGRFVSSATLAAEAMGTTATATTRASTGFSRIARQSQLAVPPLKQMTSALGGISAALVARSVTRYADAWQNAGNQLRQVTDTSSELAQVQEQLMGLANDTRSDFSSTANLYSRLARSTTELGLSQSDLIGITRTINQSFAVSGATATEAAAAITQLSQGLAAGALRGDEFNSVSEQAPGIMRAIAESLDMTIGELRDFAAEGGITAEIVVSALQESADAIEDDFSRAVATFGQQMTVARNNMLQFVGGSSDVNDALSNIGSAAITASENVGLLANAAIALAGVIGGRLVGRMITLAAGMTTAAGAAKALTTAMAFLGGPAGIAVAVTVGIGQLIDALGLMRSPTEEARNAVSLLNDELDEMNRSSIDAALIEVNSRMFELQRNAANAREELERLNNANNTPGPWRNSSVMGTGAEERGRLLDQIRSSGTEMSALSGRREELQGFLSAAEEAASGADRLGKSTSDASDALDKFSANLSPEIESILEEAGPGSTVDESGTLRDAWGNALPTLQRELDRQLQSQINAFSTEQNLMKGLEAAAQKFVDGASSAVSQAWNSIIPSSDPASGGGLLPTGDQDSAPSRAMGGAAGQALNQPRNIGSLTFRLQGDGGDGETNVEGDADDLRRLANLFSGVAGAS